MDYTRQAKEVLKIAEKSAKEMAHPYVGTDGNGSLLFPHSLWYYQTHHTHND